MRLTDCQAEACHFVRRTGLPGSRRPLRPETAIRGHKPTSQEQSAPAAGARFPDRRMGGVSDLATKRQADGRTLARS